MPKPVKLAPAKTAKKAPVKAAKKAPVKKAKENPYAIRPLESPAPAPAAPAPAAPAWKRSEKKSKPAPSPAPSPSPVPSLTVAIETAKKGGYAKSPLAPRGTDYAPHWSPFQVDIFDFVRFGSGSAIVEAVAGSGKTTTICESIRYMSGSVCALAFNRSIARELKERLAGFMNVTAGTVHAIGRRALVDSLPHFIKVDGDKLHWLFKDHLEDKTNWIARNNVCKLVTLAKDAGAGIDFMTSDLEAWTKLAEHFSVPLSQTDKDGNTLDIIALAQKLLELSNKDIKAIKNGKTMLRIDFSDMIYLPVLWNLPLQKFQWVIVDEAQDLNLTRRLFIQAISHETTRHLIVGDTFQAIYGFTGADSESMANMKATFACTSFPLSVSYRCASAIIDHAREWMPAIESAPNAKAGSVESMVYGEAMNNLEHVFGPSDSILCRNNAPLVKTAMQFIRANIPCKVEGRDLVGQLVALAKEYKTSDLLKMRGDIAEWMDEQAALALEKGNSFKAGAVTDIAETLLVFIDRSIELNATFAEMVAMIEGFFSEEQDGERRDVITLSTIHKAKGREWNKVFWLGKADFQPSRFARLPWELNQEANLCYVAATRAKETLVHLTGVKES